MLKREQSNARNPLESTLKPTGANASYECVTMLATTAVATGHSRATFALSGKRVAGSVEGAIGMTVAGLTESTRHRWLAEVAGHAAESFRAAFLDK